MLLYLFDFCAIPGGVLANDRCTARSGSSRDTLPGCLTNPFLSPRIDRAIFHPLGFSVRHEIES